MSLFFSRQGTGEELEVGDPTKKPDYRQTMNLPQTDFPMRANLSQREPGWLDRWRDMDLYHRSLEVNEGGPVFILHDGPPYANGDIHMGTAYNKVLKDIVVKYRTMRGHWSPYVPGWDCHGQPIEHQVEKDLGPQRMMEITQAELREKCREYAMTYVGRQSEQFQRLGVRGDFDDPYLTLRPAYEAGNVRVFAEMYRKGMVYRGRKPIHWCYRCKTALAEAEIEYGEETGDSIYVRFTFVEKPSVWAEVDGDVSIMIWTTTPWTLPANVAVTLAEMADYVAVRADGHVQVIAEELVDAVAEACGWAEHEVLPGRAKGADLAGLRYRLPVIEGEGVIVSGAFVDLSTGTGAVHTAPGHGEEDYLIGVKNDLPMPMPVDDEGVFDEGGGPFAGMHVDDANPEVVEWLGERGALAAAGKTSHSYPHCWRCKRPVIFRATEQWFISMDATGLRKDALGVVGDVEWVPGWSVNRISSMVADRPDWCISRQRAWGVPIPVLHCASCGEPVATAEVFDAIITLFESEGADAWFTRRPSEYLPPGVACTGCGGGELVPDSNIVDVWFESGVSHTSVLKAREELDYPADLYLEGSDQHRGWFQSALLTAVGAYGTAPYRAVLTHGFIVDGDGRKMSKSLGNVVNPLDVVERYGADVVRLWVASADYSQDISVSDEILERTAEAYRRIRNTLRFLLSNLHDHDPAGVVSWQEMPELDRYALVRLSDVLDEVAGHYDAWSYHRVYHTVYGYCVSDLSAFYLDVLKDRLYSDATGSVSRRSAQTVLAAVLGVLVRVLAPVLSFTAEEAFDHMPVSMRGDAGSVHLAGWPVSPLDAAPPEEVRELREAYAVVGQVRDVVTKALEEARNEGRIGKSQEAKVAISATDEVAAILARRAGLADAFIVSSVEVSGGVGDTAVEVSTADGSKCPRCWNWREDVGADGRWPELCGRCAEVVSGQDG